MLCKRKNTMEMLEPQAKSACQENRRNEADDRRSFEPAMDFPFIDTKKKIIYQDRRARPERRLNNMVITEIRIKLNPGFS